MPKSQRSMSTDGANFKQVLKESGTFKIELYWKQVIFARKCSEIDANYIKHIFYGRAYNAPQHATLPGKFQVSESAVHSTNVIQISVSK